jgi:hypothetical protein
VSWFLLKAIVEKLEFTIEFVGWIKTLYKEARAAVIPKKIT